MVHGFQKKTFNTEDNFNSFYEWKYILTVAIINYIDCDQSIKKQKLQVNNEILRKRRNPMQTPTCRKLSQSGFYPGPDWAKWCFWGRFSAVLARTLQHFPTFCNIFLLTSEIFLWFLHSIFGDNHRLIKWLRGVTFSPSAKYSVIKPKEQNIIANDPQQWSHPERW